MIYTEPAGRDAPDIKYLKRLMRDAEKQQKKHRFAVPEEAGAEISYIPSRPQLCWPGLLGGLYFRYLMESGGTGEKHTLSGKAKNYHRIVRKDGKILRIDTYIHGVCDGILLMHHEGNRRYGFPYLPTGERSQGYIQVQACGTTGEVVEEYLVRPNQLVYHGYQSRPDGSVLHCRFFLTRKGLTSQLHKEEGRFSPGEPLEYIQIPPPR